MEFYDPVENSPKVFHSDMYVVPKINLSQHFLHSVSSAKNVFHELPRIFPIAYPKDKGNIPHTKILVLQGFFEFSTNSPGPTFNYYWYIISLYLSRRREKSIKNCNAVCA